MAANITYLGEPGSDERTVLHWGVFDFSVNKPVLVDPEVVTSNGERIFYEHVIMKAKKNPYFTVEDVEPEPESARRRAKGRDDEDDDEDEENGNDVAIPEGWRDMHHKKLIALARRLGGEGDALATRDGALAYIEERIALDEGTNA